MVFSGIYTCISDYGAHKGAEQLANHQLRNSLMLCITIAFNSASLGDPSDGIDKGSTCHLQMLQILHPLPLSGKLLVY